MTCAPVDEVRLSRVRNRLTVTAPGYTLQIEDAADGFAGSPYAFLSGSDGTPWSSLNLLSSVDTVGMPDQTWDVEPVGAVEREGEVVLMVSTRSTAWHRHTLTLRCTPGAVELTVTVEGSGRLTGLTVFGGRAIRRSGAGGMFRSGIGFRSVLVPAPTEPVRVVRSARSAAALGVVGDADPGRLNSIFSPPPLVLGFGREEAVGATDVPEGDWLGLSVRAAVSELTFTTMRYEPLDSGFLLRLDYEGHTTVEQSWTSPTFVLRPSATGWGVVDNYREDLAAHGYAPAPAHPSEPWWHEPIFCGWGAQSACAAQQLHAGLSVPMTSVPMTTVPMTTAEEGLVARLAAGLATQVVYDEFLARLDAHELRPGTIVIDDRWQAEYGTATPDLGSWPDLRGWIAERHARGQKVLLWWKAWDPAGLPAEECVLDPAGRPVAVDPANPAYRARLRGIVDHLLSKDGLDADGFKVDFTQRTPSGQTLTATDGVWGIASLHVLLGTLYRAAKEAKPDALVICHAVHPSFADVCDMVRLNDVLKSDLQGRPVPAVDQLVFRQRIATRALPAHPIDTDQWPMPTRSQWLEYSLSQPALGVPSLYYLESIDRSGEQIEPEDLARIASSWAAYRESIRQ